jgi:hypothetical protein
VIKIFRRTPDPDVFQVVGHAPSHTLTSGLNTVAVNLPVKSGDMIGFNASGAPSSCTFSAPGDSVLVSAGNLSDGATGTFTAQNDVRLNLPVLVPDNGFALGGISETASRARLRSPPPPQPARRGARRARKSKSLAVAGPVTFSSRQPAGPPAAPVKRSDRRAQVTFFVRRHPSSQSFT